VHEHVPVELKTVASVCTSLRLDNELAESSRVRACILDSYCSDAFCFIHRSKSSGDITFKYAFML
jgi:hypothetical protein